MRRYCEKKNYYKLAPLFELPRNEFFLVRHDGIPANRLSIEWRSVGPACMEITDACNARLDSRVPIKCCTRQARCAVNNNAPCIYANLGHNQLLKFLLLNAKG
jgi:hypothetical protein